MQEHLAVYPGEGHREFRGELRAGFGRRFFPLCQRGEVFGGFARSGGSLFRRRIDDESGAGKAPCLSRPAPAKRNPGRQAIHAEERRSKVKRLFIRR